MKNNSTILIVDDTSTNLLYLDVLLSKEGYIVIKAKSGEEALEILNNPSIELQLILLDVVMNGINGFEVCKAIKSNKKTKDIPVIFITSNTDTESIVKGFQVGGQDFVNKPFRVPELLERVNTQFKLKRKSDEVNKYVNELVNLNKELLKLNFQLDQQNQLIEKKNKDLLDSIAYARLVQKAILAPIEVFQKVFLNSFIIQKPRDIVSGDFFLIQWKDDLIYFGSVDCTGHGVPGALLSVVAKNALEQAIFNHNLIHPNDILNQLAVNIKINIPQEKNHQGLHDGLDIALCTFNPSTKTLEFSGAKQSVCLIRNGCISELKTNTKSIGLRDFSKEDFYNINLNIEKDDRIYLFSDGFQDQMGGPERKKFSKKRFKNLLLETSMYSISDQKNYIEKELQNWMQNIEQYDDILVIGICFDDNFSAIDEMF